MTRFLNSLTHARRWPVALLWICFSCLAVAAAPKKQHLSFEMTLSTEPDELFFRTTDNWQVGVGGLNGTAIIAGQPVDVKLVASLEYENGSGPFAGSVTFYWSLTDILAMRYTGTTERNIVGDTSIYGRLEAVGGSGRFAQAKARGTVYGFRSGVLGGAVDYQIEIDLGPGGGPGAGDLSIDDKGPKEKGAHPLKSQLNISVGLVGDPGDQFVRNIGANPTLTIGYVRLLGATVVGGEPVQVELAGAIEYRDGEGPFNVYLHFDFADGSRLICRRTGRAERRKDGSTILRGDVVVLYGTGAFAGARGEGTAVSSRTGPPGSPVQTDISLRLSK